ARDLNHEKLHSYPLAMTLPQDPARPLYINTNDTINRNSTAAAIVFSGAPSPQRADLATMWVILGQPVTSVAIPVWPYSGKIPEVAAASGQETCQLNSLSRKLVAYLYPDERGRMPQYLNVTRLRTYGGEGLLTKLLRIENQLLERTSAQLSFWEKKKEPADQVARFQTEMANFVWQSLRLEFSDLK
ncbi:MAG: hypothetical protein KA000_02160, partial [Candidatus Saccharicenans sp.]|nr:hypothetical protein [Candidatus Saccharicenans sp.]